MYKHNKETLYLERQEMAGNSFFDSYFKDPRALPDGVVSISQVETHKIPTRYMLQLGGVKASQDKVVYKVEFKCRKERDSRF